MIKTKKIMTALLLFVISIFPMYGEEISLIEKFQYAEKGDYVVTLANKVYTFLHVFETAPHAYIIEEVSVPLHKVKLEKTFSWKEWFSLGAASHTSWVMYEVMMPSGDVRESFSFTHNGWLKIDPRENIFSTLLQLPFSRVSQEKRQRAGPAPLPGEMDRRSVWNPPLTVEGERIPKAAFAAWRSSWPSDGSEMSGRVVEIYLPRDKVRAPTYFPYWMNIFAVAGKAKMRVVDAGRDAHSVKEMFPRRPPEVTKTEYKDGDIVITMKSPMHYETFSLWALPVEGYFSHPIVLDNGMISRDEEMVTLSVAAKEIDEKLSRKKLYRFLVVPKEYDDVFFETREPFFLPDVD
jgi:hypothetical protein